MYLGRISILRKERKLRQVDLASLLHTTQEQYSRYECGDRQLPLHHLATLANFNRVSADYIVELTGERKPYRPKEASAEASASPLLALRRERGLTQAQVGKMLGILRNQYGRYDAGERPIPLKHLIALAKFYKAPADYMLGLTDEREPHERTIWVSPSDEMR